MPKNKPIPFRITREMWIVICITVLYAIISAIGLGDSEVPVTEPDMGDGAARSAIAYAAFEEPTSVGSLLLYKGLGTLGVTVYVPDADGTSWVEVTRQVCEDVYRWIEIPIGAQTEMVCVSVGADAHAALFEVGFLSSEGNIIPVLSDGSAMFDEQHLVPTAATDKNGMIFDEVYHARTAYEHLHGIPPYEITHPPLGKLLIAVGIALLGMNPLGWRISGWLIGVLMIPVLYALAKRILGRSGPALTASALLSLDFLHFTQSRTALIDGASVLLIMLSYLLMYRYFDSTPEDLPHGHSLRLLAACGAVMGLGIAVKWTVIYAALGLAALFFIAAVRRGRAGEVTWKSCLFCVLFFGAIPLTIYFLSYIPYFIAEPTGDPFRIFLENQVYMLTYHAGLDAAHSYASPWYTWPLMLRPVWYYGAKSLAAEGLCSSVAALGNPAVWWCGTLSVLYLLVKPKKTRADAFVLIGFAAQYLPWALITRPLFLYHFYASVPFVILAAVIALDDLSSRWKACRRLAPMLILCAALLFVMFYPILSGAVTDRSYVIQVLQWLPGWQFCY